MNHSLTVCLGMFLGLKYIYILIKYKALKSSVGHEIEGYHALNLLIFLALEEGQYCRITQKNKGSQEGTSGFQTDF